MTAEVKSKTETILIITKPAAQKSALIRKSKQLKVHIYEVLLISISNVNPPVESKTSSTSFMVRRTDLFCVQETWLKPSLNLIINGTGGRRLLPLLKRTSPVG